MNRTARRLGLAALLLLGLAGGCARQDSAPLRVGVVHSLTGTMAASEKPLVEAVRMAVDEINARGGLLGRQVKVIVADSRSDPDHAAREAERLIDGEKVDVLFACWTSACRQAVRPVVEQHHHLMFYPVQYEGLELSPNIVYTGATANQQIIPGTQWALEHLGKRVFLVGSNYVFPRVGNRIVHDVVIASAGPAAGAEVVGELYRPLGDRDFSQVIAAIRATKPDVIFNTVNGDSNIALFSALRQAGLNQLPVMSFSVDASSLPSLAPFGHTRHYAAWGYFQALPGEANRRFVSAWQARRGKAAPTSDPIEAAYVGVKLWAQAVVSARSAKLDEVNLALARESVAAPSGVLAVDAGTRHLWKPFHVGKVVAGADAAQAGFEVVFGHGTPLRPEPFPVYRMRDAWENIGLTALIDSRESRP
ncbi:MAG: urea ABC transporter substrate-binding protein [Hydrogenophilales bacterium 28-61-23]|nr:MAG: urea ABC transporter substrate-binding protein [Hydrogenophilales bacterium 28-61-23]